MKINYYHGTVVIKDLDIGAIFVFPQILNGCMFLKVNHCVYLVYPSYKNKILNVDKPVST